MPRPDLTAHLLVTFTECFETVYSNKVRVLNVLKEFVLSGTPKNLRWNSLLMVSEISLSKELTLIAEKYQDKLISFLFIHHVTFL